MNEDQAKREPGPALELQPAEPPTQTQDEGQGIASSDLGAVKTAAGPEAAGPKAAGPDAAAPEAADPQEAKLIRRLQMMMNMVMNVIAQDGSLSVDDASQMIADARTAALTMFPGKELAYDLIWKPRFQRLMRERFRLM